MNFKDVAVAIRDELGFSVRNKNGVEFYYHPGDAEEIEVYYDFSDTDETVAFSLYYCTAEEFAADFAMFDFRDMYSIKPEALAKRFERGDAKVYCCVDGADDCLRFQWDDVLLYAEDYDGVKHLVCKVLVSAEDYIAYTEAYYEDREYEE